MGVLFGLVAAVICSVIAAAITLVLGFRDGDHPGDARVTVRGVVHAGADNGADCADTEAFAEILIENGHETPVMVSARSRRASVLALALAAPQAQRTALTHRRGLDRIELLGAVEGQGARRYLLPLDRAHTATKVTVFVDQFAHRTRITTATLRASAERPLRSAAPRDVADA